jgi:Zn2+/Cd2+-exporting ATPase
MRGSTASIFREAKTIRLDLSKVAEAVHLGRRTVHVIQFNIAFSIAVKLIFLVLAVLGYTSLWLAIAADTGATLIVTANALRLLR